MIKSNNRAKIIALCGIDGSGKTSTLSRLAKEQQFSKAAFVKKENRNSINNLLALYPDQAAASQSFMHSNFARQIRWGHGFDFLRFYEEEVLPFLNTKALIFSDRWSICSFAYAYAGTQTGPIIKDLLSVIPPPDLLIYLDVHPQTSLKRIQKRGAVNSDEAIEILTAYREAYLKLIEEMKEVNCVTIDSDQMNEMMVYEAVKSKILKYA